VRVLIVEDETELAQALARGQGGSLVPAARAQGGLTVTATLLAAGRRTART